MPVKYGLAIAWFVTLVKKGLVNKQLSSQPLSDPEPELSKTPALCPVY